MIHLDNATTLLQISLIARAIFFFIVFALAGYLTIHTNTKKQIIVYLLGAILIAVGLFNVVMAFEWYFYFY